MSVEGAVGSVRVVVGAERWPVSSSSWLLWVEFGGIKKGFNVVSS